MWIVYKIIKFLDYKLQLLQEKLHLYVNLKYRMCLSLDIESFLKQITMNFYKAIKLG